MPEYAVFGLKVWFQLRADIFLYARQYKQLPLSSPTEMGEDKAETLQKWCFWG